jgi:hypothetical protein
MRRIEAIKDNVLRGSIRPILCAGRKSPKIRDNHIHGTTGGIRLQEDEGQEDQDPVTKTDVHPS